MCCYKRQCIRFSCISSSYRGRRSCSIVTKWLGCTNKDEFVNIIWSLLLFFDYVAPNFTASSRWGKIQFKPLFEPLFTLIFSLILLHQNLESLSIIIHIVFAQTLNHKSNSLLLSSGQISGCEHSASHPRELCGDCCSDTKDSLFTSNISFF